MLKLFFFLASSQNLWNEKVSFSFKKLQLLIRGEAAPPTGLGKGVVCDRTMLGWQKV